MKIFWMILAIAVCVLLLLLLAALIHTLCTPQKKTSYEPHPEADREKMCAEKLSAMVRVDTTSYPDTYEKEKFDGFHETLEQLFPLVHQKLAKTEIDGNLLFYWKGKQSTHPLVLMSHQDVVPAEGTWSHAPFSGDLADGKVWGRGASDTKCSVMGFFEAAEELLAQGYVPENDVYLSSSCTEEWAGDGCGKLVAELKKRKVRPYLVCDEGGGIIADPMHGIPGNFAMVGLFEKGKADVKFTAESNGGHASTPSKNSPLARIAAFVNEVETHPVFRSEMSKEVERMFNTLAPYASSFGLRYIFGNTWLFKPLLVKLMPSISAQAGAMLKTTIAFTKASGSDAYNVMPQEATLGANMRFIPHQGMKESIDIITKLAAEHDLKTEVLYATDASHSVDIESDAFQFFTKMIDQTFPGVAVSPYVMTGATDARNYQDICDTVVRFAPVIYGPEQMKGMHGLNENIETNCLPGCVDFYKNLIQNLK